MSFGSNAMSYSSFMLGSLERSSFSTRPSATAWRCGPSSIIATSICGLSFCARSFASV
jgi:hypothetical protein